MRSRRAIVGAILRKDLATFARDRFYVTITLLGLVFYVAVFWLLPAQADETLLLGIHLDAGDLAAVLGGEVPVAGATEEGIQAVPYPDGDRLQAAVEAGEVAAGLDFPPGFVADVAAGEGSTVRVLVTGDAPAELRPALTALVREVAFAVAGEAAPVRLPDVEAAVLGIDRSGAQLSLRAQFRPIFVFLVLLVEMFALASLVAVELQQRTISAILVTPARVGDVLAAKTVLGTGLAFFQAFVLLLATGTWAAGFGVVSVALLLGAVLVTGVAMIAGSSGGDFITIVFLSVLFMIPLAVPAVAVLFPGTTAAWVQALPTYGLVRIIVDVTGYGMGWADVLPDLVLLAAWGVVALGAGVLVLRRRVVRL